MRLGSVGSVRREMSRIFREMRSGELDTTKGCKLTYTLLTIGKLIESEIIEQRLQALERATVHA